MTPRFQVGTAGMDGLSRSQGALAKSRRRTENGALGTSCLCLVLL